MQCEMFVGDMGATSVVPSLSAKGGSNTVQFASKIKHKHNYTSTCGNETLRRMKGTALMWTTPLCHRSNSKVPRNLPVDLAPNDGLPTPNSIEIRCSG
ncbi:hypothetical protein BRADI_3g10815v3 [Brachypodium distachyon]|uniref:Uncharacterized protein n=1 Tax=Brachypodium distachyon TaxID=15368 RepID=A0A2K2CWH1_BRADI|nr:hypothetical protein BRADI_3g10815v3 [Brachypodium distachyon]